MGTDNGTIRDMDSNGTASKMVNGTMDSGTTDNGTIKQKAGGSMECGTTEDLMKALVESNLKISFRV